MHRCAFAGMHVHTHVHTRVSPFLYSSTPKPHFNTNSSLLGNDTWNATGSEGCPFSYKSQLGKGESCQPQRHKHPPGSRATATQPHGTRGPKLLMWFYSWDSRERSVPAFGKKMSPDLLVALSPIPSVDGYYSAETQAVTVLISLSHLLPILTIHTNNSPKRDFQHLSSCPLKNNITQSHYQVLSAIRSTLHKLIHLILTTDLWGRFYY